MTITINGTTGIAGVDGSASVPAVQGNDTNTGMFFPTADTIAFATAGTEDVRIDSVGNVGIGTTNPSERLDIRNSAGRVSIFMASGGTNQGYISYFNNTQLLSFGMGAPTGTGTNGGQQVNINASGELMVGKLTSPDVVTGAAIFQDGTIRSSVASSISSGSTMHVYSTTAGAYRFYVNMAGQVFATSTTIVAISDQRLKENIQDLDVGLDAVMALKPRKFDWKEGKGKNKKGDRGWIAQEFEQVFPDMIETWKDPAPEGEEPYKAVNADLIPVLVKAIQEQQAIIEQLKADVAALKGTA